ncbi:MAG: alpha-amylase family glycosyl hydrolase [Oscillospiraceae bacterium]|nr:alpha-amylase family glycosyl hydrolase [Oscillospiraceae bacterium]
MAWYDEAVFYHIYPLGLTGAPKQNTYSEPEHRLSTLIPWIDHMKKTGFNALYIGPLFESVGHGYETTDYKKLDSRLGTNEDLKNFVDECHKSGIKVIFDGVFNHTGRDFFAFKDIKEKREASAYRDWYCNVNFGGNNEYNDGFSYDNWGGYNLLAKLNQKNPAVKNYICDVIRFWVSEFDVDGIRLDAADVLDFDFMKELRKTANEVKPDFWLMGEVIHGDYSRWVNGETLHSVTNYVLHKALYSGHNDHNYFEIAHTVKRLYEMGGNKTEGLKLYNFADNHDVERIYTKLNNKAHFAPVHILMYTLPGVPSVYYGSEFGIEGKKEKFSDASLRPALSVDDYKDAAENNPCTKLIAALGKIRSEVPALSYGDYCELMLTNRQYAFSRNYNGMQAIVTVNNDDASAPVNVPAACTEYTGMLSGRKVSANGGRLSVELQANSGDIWVSSDSGLKSEAVPVEFTVPEPVRVSETEKAPVPEKCEKTETTVKTESVCAENTDAAEEKNENKKTADEKLDLTKPYEDMTVAELQACILQKMAKNGPVTEQMKKDVDDNIWRDSLLNWVKSFR